MFVLILWLIGEGGQAFFNTGVGNVVALVFGLGLIAAGFGGLFLLPFFLGAASLDHWKQGDRLPAVAWGALAILILAVLLMPASWVQS